MTVTIIKQGKSLQVREVMHFCDPPKSALQQITTLDVGLIELSHAAAKEALGSGGPFGAFHDFFLSTLTHSKRLTWQNNGSGMGRELRRSYSNIHGRAFARFFLEKYEGVLDLLPLEGASTWIAGGVNILKRQGEKGDMPDWFGWTSTGLVIAEAKGTYEGSNWKKKLTFGDLPGCLEDAQKQIARAQINIVSVGADIDFKGWAVASRWRTENNALDPWLVATDPAYGKVILNPDDFEKLIVKLQREYLRRALIVSGFNVGQLITKEMPTELAIPFGDIVSIRLEDGFELVGLLIAIGSSGFIPIRKPDAQVFLTELAEKLGVWSVLIITEEYLKAVRDNFFYRAPESRSTVNSFLRNGIAILALRWDQADRSTQVVEDG